jgi:(p)ppGpp synthase/HD superfamily hydrolase
MFSNPNVYSAFHFMLTAHEGQKDKVGNAYWEHPLRVAKKCQEAEYGTSAIIVGLLHDVLEDTQYTLEDICQKVALSEDEQKALILLTRKSDETYAEFIERIAQSAHPIAIRVKIKDLEHNMDLSRFALRGVEPTKKDYERITKYFHAYQKLIEALKKERWSFSI